MRKYLSLRNLEKMTYIIGVPALLGYAGYTLHQQSLKHEQERVKELQDIERQYLEKHKKNLVKLENFRKKVYAIGVYDELVGDKKLTTQQKKEISNNAMTIRNIIKEIKPEAVVLELCEDRYDHWYYDLVSHPNYDKTLSEVHKIFDEGKPEKLLDYEGVDLDKAGLEYLIGLDICSYRMMPCKTIFGDRSIKITNKRYKSKIKMLDVYKEALATQDHTPKQTQKDSKTSSKKTIFDLEQDDEKGQNQQSDTISKLRSALKELNMPALPEAPKQSSQINIISDQAIKESVKTVDQIYDEVVIDEINDELMKSAQKCDADVIVLLMRMERLKSFEKLWKQVNLDFYQTQTNRRSSAAAVVAKEEASKDGSEVEKKQEALKKNNDEVKNKGSTQKAAVI